MDYRSRSGPVGSIDLLLRTLVLHITTIHIVHRIHIHINHRSLILLATAILQQKLPHSWRPSGRPSVAVVSGNYASLVGLIFLNDLTTNVFVFRDDATLI